MTLQELLKSKGVADDVINAIVSGMKENKIYTSGEENLDIRYNKLKTDHDGTVQQLTDANALIETLKKSEKGNEGLQTKIAEYETQVQSLQAELYQAKLEAALKVALLAEKATDVDYLTFKIKEKGDIELDENDKIKGLNDKLDSLKIQFPNQFETSTNRKIEEHKLEDGEDQSKVSKEAFEKMGYLDRVKLFKESPETYAEMTKN